MHDVVENLTTAKYDIVNLKSYTEYRVQRVVVNNGNSDDEPQ